MVVCWDIFPSVSYSPKRMCMRVAVGSVQPSNSLPRNVEESRSGGGMPMPGKDHEYEVDANGRRGHCSGNIYCDVVGDDGSHDVAFCTARQTLCWVLFSRLVLCDA